MGDVAGGLGKMVARLRNRGVNRLRGAGDAARDRGDWPEAAAKYRAYLDKRPENTAIWVQLGHALKETGDLAGARDAYGVALERTPDDADLQLSLGHLAKVAGDSDEAAYRYRLSHRIDANEEAAREFAKPELWRHFEAADARIAREG